MSSRNSYNYNYSRSSSAHSSSVRSTASGRNYSSSSGRTGSSRADASRSSAGRTREYIDGNTVRRVQEMPARRQPQPKTKSFEEVRRERDRKAAVRRNMQRAMALNRRYVAFLTIATVICLIACVYFINLQSDISARMSDIAATETAISEQKAANDILESKVETGMTLDQVKERADELGLVYPETSQIEYFSVESDDYMNQYADVASK